MIRLYILVLLSIMFTGCDLKQPPAEIDPDLIYDATPVYSEETSDYPYDHPRYQAVLDGSKLQYPNDDFTYEYEELYDYKSEGFFADQDGYLYFTSSKEPDTYKTRSELRQRDEWRTDDPDGNYWLASLKCLKPQVGISSYTWMQIHGTNESYNYPILRLLWERQRSGLYDHLWAVVIVNDPLPNEIFQYSYYDLGPRTDEFFSAEVHMVDNRMYVMIDRDVKVAISIEYWQEVINYFKAGIYLNRFADGGEATVIFDKLEFLDYADPNKVVPPFH